MDRERRGAGGARAGAWARAGLVLALVLLADQVTKALVRADIDPGQSDAIFPGLQLVHVRNQGVAFGFFSGGGIVVPIVIGIALLGLLSYFASHPQRRLLWLPTGLLLGGALGNLADRVRDGAVTDFLKLPLWPAFNLADVAITFGVLALFYALERPPRHGSR